MSDPESKESTKVEGSYGKYVAVQIKQEPKRYILHDRKCVMSTPKNPKGCSGGNQEIMGEYRYKGKHMVQLFCHPCGIKYSVSISLLSPN